MTEWWTHLVADVADWFPGGLFGLLLAVVVAAVLVGLAIQRRGLFRWRPSRRRAAPPREAKVTAEIEETDDELVPDVPGDVLVDRAHRYTASGDYRRAVREWLRVMVRDLIDDGGLVHSPGMTVTELATAAGWTVPGAAGPMSEAAEVFSAIWYGGVEADIASAERMRGLRDRLATALVPHSPVLVRGAEAAS
ncbi:uncharacterized protein DUF4129 [Stackebrandtia albiflava]|uniref:Uncharacterized protein DUF4129 n=1 Tax=Stackebrandtia albiflava TaxID=406432 RepID=A0A562V4L6_9ACTN|nr:DUF4129 domain-containing protein [Stackebrandtia albiflava]TWJ12834.1 uncharacterized protein DUF4129 [Stackebrandtia albiflava]